MIGLLSTRYYWPRIATDVHNYCKQYQTCQACKVVTRALYGQLQSLTILEYSWQYVTIDLIISLPKTNHGVDIIATFIDQFSKYTYFVPITTAISADDLAQIILSTVVNQHGVFEHLISDHDPYFVLAFQERLMSALGTSIVLSIVYYPQMDSQSE